MQKKTEYDIVHMTDAQCVEVKADIERMEKMLNDPRDWVRKKITDVNEVKTEIQKKKDLLKAHVPKKLRGQKANKAFARAKELKEYIQKHMPDRKSYFQPYAKDSDSHKRQADFERTVKQQMEFQKNPEIQKAIIQYKNIMRRIDPQDPSISNIEALRK